MSTEPIRFLGATVISFNAQLGLGASESTLNVDLVEDCENGDIFIGQSVGAPVYFTAGEFIFGGVLSNWTVSQGGSGKTYNVKIVDPRQLLENVTIIVDSCIAEISSPNYFNAYAYWESNVLNGDCRKFGESYGGDRGMPYYRVLSALRERNLRINDPTGTYSYSVNWSSFPSNLPEYYRITGPNVTLLQLLQDVCDVTGYDFYVTLSTNNMINIGLVNLRAPPPPVNAIISAYDGYATELSYGQELRNEVTKSILFGEKRHYLSTVTQFANFFGEDYLNGVYYPVVPFDADECGFWFKKQIDSLNSMLKNPFPNNSYIFHELDIRCALSNMELWMLRVCDSEVGAVGGTFNNAFQAAFPLLVTNTRKNMKALFEAAAPEVPNGIVETAINPLKSIRDGNTPEILSEIEIIYNWIKNLGSTFYGKQFIAPLNQLICVHQDLDKQPLKEFIFSDVPTNDGGWVDYGVPVLGLADPDLTLFRQEDNRIGAFAIFNNSGEAPASSESESESEST